MLALLATPLVVVVHEAAHGLAALALGGRGVRLRWIRWGLAVEAELASDARRVVFLLAGPLASVVVGAALAAARGWWGVVGAVSILFGLLTLAGSDGRQAFALVRALARTGVKSNDSR